MCLEVRYRIHCFSTLDWMLFNSMQQSPSWQANTPQLIKKFLLPTPPHFMEREGSLLHSQKPDTSLSWTRWIHSIPSSHLLKIHFNIIIQFMHGSSKFFHSQHLFISKFYMHVRRWESIADRYRTMLLRLSGSYPRVASEMWQLTFWKLMSYCLSVRSLVCGTRRFVTAFTQTRLWNVSRARWLRCVPYFFTIRLNVIPFQRLSARHVLKTYVGQCVSR